jgi:hypothetical protein
MAQRYMTQGVDHALIGENAASGGKVTQNVGGDAAAGLRTAATSPAVSSGKGALASHAIHGHFLLE